MPREVTPQADQHAQSPHVQNVHRLNYPRDPDDIAPGSPQDHAQHVSPSFSPYDKGDGDRAWDPNTGYQPSAHDERMSELAADDDYSGYNWGPPPAHNYDPHHPEIEDDPYPYA